MTRYPTPSDYVEALQAPEHAFTDPELARGVVESNALGLPRVITGAHAAVFRVTTATGDIAVRLFHTEDPFRRRRYHEVIRFLDSVDWPFVVPIEYQQRGIQLAGASWPLVRMPWVGGRSLSSWLDENHRDALRLAAVCEQWLAVASTLEDAEFAHGDLQHGNILVVGEEPRIVLVDYDGTYVPRLKGQSSREVGHRNYQHPDRTTTDYGPHIDRFALLAVYVALVAIRVRPELWDRFSTGENLLFTSEDFFDPAGSVLFDELLRIDAVASVAHALRTACLGRLEDVPALTDVLEGRAVRSVSLIRRQPSAGERARTNGWERWARPAALAVIVVSIAAVLVQPWTGLLVLGVGTVAWLALSVATHRRQPSVRRRSRLLEEASVLDHWIEDLEEDLLALAAQRHNVAHRSRELAERRLEELRDEAIHSILKHRFIGELGDDPAVGHRAVIRMKAGGIRTAYHITRQRLDAVKGLGPANRARAEAWRAELLLAADEAIPQALTRVEMRRLERVVERQVAEVAAEEARLEQKIALQREERSRVWAQVNQLPATGLSEYLTRLLTARRGRNYQ